MRERFVSGCVFTPVVLVCSRLVGKELAFDISIRGGAMLYTIGFSA